MLGHLQGAFRVAGHALPAWPPLGGVLLQAARGIRRTAAARRRELQEVDDAVLPKVALVGRPNVGKSALFNRLVRRRAALVYDTPDSHVTRDYQEARGRLGDLVFRAADTSGLEPRTAGGATIQARATALTAKLLQQSHVALMVVDAKSGVLPADEELADWLRRHVPPERVMLVANKAEGARAREEMPQTVYDCYRLGFGEPVALSATTGEGMTDLYAALQPRLDEIRRQLEAAEAARAVAEAERRRREEEEEEAEEDEEEGKGAGRGAAARRRQPLFRGVRPGKQHGEERDVAAESDDEVEGAAGAQDAASISNDDISTGGLGIMRLAIMGLPNAGKSTLLNALLGEERALTGPEAGLTRDAVRAAWMYGQLPVELVDTAGWIGVGRLDSYDDVGGEVASLSRRATMRSLARVHVVLLVLDAEKAIRNERVLTSRELSLAGSVLREGKALVVVANKADALTAQERRIFGKALRQHLSERFLEAGQVPVVEVSAKEGRGIGGIMPVAAAAYEAWNKRVSTARLNRFVRKLSLRMAGSGTDVTLARIKYMAQVKARPPTFAAFMSGSSPVGSEFAAFLSQQIREVMGFQGVPMRVWFRYKERHGEHLKRLRSQAKRRKAEEEEGGLGGDDGVDGGSLMQQALRRAEELRRDGGDDYEQGKEAEEEEEEEEEEEDVKPRRGSLQARRSRAGAGLEARGAVRRKAEAGGGAGGDAEREADDEEERVDRARPRPTSGSSEPAAASGAAPAEALQVAPREDEAHPKAATTRGAGRGSASGTASSRVVRLDAEDEEEEWRWAEGRGGASSASQRPASAAQSGDESAGRHRVALGAAAAAAVAAGAAASVTRSRLSAAATVGAKRPRDAAAGTAAGGAGGRADGRPGAKRELLFRAMMYGRKPSAALLPVKLPSRGKRRLRIPSNRAAGL